MQWTRAVLVLWLGVLGAGEAAAQGMPLGPDPDRVFEGRVGYAATADTLLSCGAASCGGLGGPNCTGRAESVAVLDQIPDSETLRVVHARLNWAASTAADDAPDDEVTLTPPGGDALAVAADPALSEQFIDGAPPGDCAAVEFLCGMPGACDLSFYSNFADVTAAVEAHRASGGRLNGEWRLSDVSVPGASDQDPATVIAALGSLTIGAWSLLVVYEDAETQPTRRVYYYQGFELNSGVPRTLFPRGFRAPPPDPQVDLTLMVLEGDEGVLGDQLRVNGRQVSDGCNPVNNLFNSTVNTGRADGMCRRGVFGVDLDRFTVVGAVAAGDEEAEVTLDIPRGDGLFTAGEQVFTNWMVLAFDHLLPDFEGLKPEKDAEPRHETPVRPGQAISYRILLDNDGDAPATGVVVADPLDEWVEYVEGSTVIGVTPIPDRPGGVFPLQEGFEITELAAIGPEIGVGERHRVQFSVRVRDDAPHGVVIRNVATIAADLIEPVETDEVAHPVVVGDGGVPPIDRGVPDDMMVPRDAMVDAMGDDMGDGMSDRDARVERDGGAADMRRAEVGPLVEQPDGSSPCGPGTRLDESGFCVSVCGPGLVWDPNCGAAGQCIQESAEPCDDGGGSPGAGGCGCDAGGGGPGPVALVLVGLLWGWRRSGRGVPSARR